LIVRQVDHEDRRRARFKLTARGAAVDRERRGTVEAAVRRALSRADRGAVQASAEMLDLLARELVRAEG
jgi:hypothetical protein